MIREERKISNTLRNFSLIGIIVLGLMVIASCGGGKRAIDAAKMRYFTGNSFTNSIGMEFILIPEGTFMMGSLPDETGRGENEEQHPVTIEKPYYLQTTEVTQGQWNKVMKEKIAHFKHCGDDCPVENVSWNDAQKFIRKLNRLEKTNKYRLPTEAEWEYACKAGTTSVFYTGDCISSKQANYNGKYPLGDCPEGEYMYNPIAVGSFAPNPWGLYDMHGNVWEWCQDWNRTYADSSPKSSEYRARRGGSWSDKAQYLRSSSRLRVYPKYSYKYSGFRVAGDVAAQ